MRDLVAGKRHLPVPEQRAPEQVADGVVFPLDRQRRRVLDAGVPGVGDALDALGDDELLVAVACFGSCLVEAERVEVVDAATGRR